MEIENGWAVEAWSIPRAKWKEWLDTLSDCDAKEALKKWLRLNWNVKGCLEDFAYRKAEEKIRQAELRKHEKLVADTKRKKR